MCNKQTNSYCTCVSDVFVFSQLLSHSLSLFPHLLFTILHTLYLPFLIYHSSYFLHSLGVCVYDFSTFLNNLICLCILNITGSKSQQWIGFPLFGFDFSLLIEQLVYRLHLNVFTNNVKTNGSKHLAQVQGLRFVHHT